ncbi:Helicase associated domain protein [Glycomyces sp. NPDC047369]
MGGAAALWPHQVEAVRAVESALAAGGRATVVMACGTGKTRVAAEAVRCLADAGRALVLVPTRELLYQTVDAHRGVDAGERAWIAVCSPWAGPPPSAADQDAIDGLEADGVPVTTDPQELHRLLRSSPAATVVATYASLPVITALHSGQGLEWWDLIVVDEAHRSAGADGAAWTAVHDDEVLPARRRLYLTATPRLYGGDAEAVSMDDASVYGPVAYRLPFAEAIDQGLLADYRLVIGVVTKAEIAALTEAAAVVGIDGQALPARMLATQIATARAVDEYGLRRLLSFHHTIAAAKRFAETFPNTLDLVPRAPGSAYIALYHVNGKMRLDARRSVLAHLDHPGPRAVCVANCRVLSEGVDVPALDGVVFADPRESQVDVVQAVGRALRRGPTAGKVATIVVPVLISGDEAPDAALEDSQWATVWKVLRALRSHDDRLADELDRQRVHPLGAGNHTGERTPTWEFSGLSVGAEWAEAIALRLVDAATPRWIDSYAAAVRYAADHGHLNVPAAYIDADGFRLGGWIALRRMERRRGTLAPERAEKLEAIGMVWEPSQAAWQRQYEQARDWHTRRGGLDPTQLEHPGLHQWLYRQRLARIQGTLAPEQIAALDALGFQWEPISFAERAWMDGIAAAERYVHEHGHLTVSKGAVFEGHNLGNWLASRRAEYRNGTLEPWKTAALETIGIVWDLKAERWKRGLAAAEAFHAEHGHLRVPDHYLDDDGFALGKWIAWNRSRRRGTKKGQTISAEHQALLDAIGMVWEVKPRRSADA